MKKLSDYIRDIPDFPKKGIIFKDITTLLKDKIGFAQAIDEMCEKIKNIKVDKIIGIESRGFIFASAMCYKLNAGLVLVRKPGKLPSETESISYELEYGEDTIEIHKDSISKGEKILVVDDLIATGGTAKAVCDVVEKLGGEIVATEFLIELSFLEGRKKLKNYPFFSLIKF